MRQTLLVGLGGFIGAIARFKLGGWVLHRSVDWQFPLSTFLVNVSGCLVAGVLWAVAERWEVWGADTRAFLFAGLLGGFTTFSAFGLETVFLIRRESFLIALANVGLSVVCGIGVLWIVMKLVLAVGTR